MPGLNQLKKFSQDIIKMGREPERRRMKGETIPLIPLPQNASEADDSSQFVLGLPQEGDFSSDSTGLTSSAETDTSQDEEIDIEALLANALAEQNAKNAGSAAPAEPVVPSEPAPQEPTSDSTPLNLDDDNLFGDISDFGSSDGTLDALADFEADTAGLFSDPAIDDLTAPESVPEETATADFLSETEPVAGETAADPLADFGSLDDMDFLSDADSAAAEPAGELSDFAVGNAGDTSGVAGFDDFSFTADDIPDVESFDDAGMEPLTDAASAENVSLSGINDEFAITDDTQFMDMNDDIPESMQEGPGTAEDPFAGMGELDFGSDAPSAGSDDFTLDSASDFAPEGDADEPAVPEMDAVSSDDFNLDSLGDFGDFATADDVSVPNAADVENSGSTDDVIGVPDIGGALDFDSPDTASDFALPEATGDFAELGELGELGELDNLDAVDSADATASADSGADDFSMPDFDLGGSIPGGSDDFDLPPVEGLDVMDLPDGSAPDASGFASTEDDFSIPGFSDFDMITPQESSAKKEENTVQKKNDEPVPLKTELTDSEYTLFLENLDYYPLNVRLALQDMIVKNEFTDDAVMDVINKVIKKIPARQLAAHLEKLLDVSLPVPINYEKRTAAEYEAYKQSLAYQLRNKIIPIAIASFFSLLFCILFGWLIAKFVVTPVKAELLYKEGYELISNGMYPQAEQKFNEAVSYKAKQKWYFTYARRYREERQYDRAGSIYQRLLNRFDHNKTAGLEYAEMELNDRSNYARAEEIVRREILDYHIDDPEGMLLLGDVFLEWATNSDETKFDDALYAYEDLMYMYGQTDLHLSRMLRYYMRTDQIPKVLELKSYFYPKMQKNPKKQILENCDQVELSGYLLDKMFGTLSPKNEYLRAYIEDVRDLLEMAVKSCEKTNDMDAYPEAVYNYGRYFVETSNPEPAITVLTRAAELLESAPRKSHKRTLCTINTYRLLGELYGNGKKYLDAETMYAEGLTLFEYEKKNNALEPDENVGLLYADMADIDYFLSGDYDAALRNYESAINNLNDTPSIRYRVGWIQYVNGNYSEALGSFIKVITDKPSEKNALFALGNTLAFRNSTSAAAGYYEKLLDELNLEIQRADISLTRVQDIDQEDLFTLYMKTTNNLGVALSQVASQTSDSQMNARAISQFSNSIQAYDALHRNPETYVRLPGSNLAEMNLKYHTVPASSYEPEFYSDLSRVLTDELMLRQADE